MGKSWNFQRILLWEISEKFAPDIAGMFLKTFSLLEICLWTIITACTTSSIQTASDGTTLGGPINQNHPQKVGARATTAKRPTANPQPSRPPGRGTVAGEGVGGDQRGPPRGRAGADAQQRLCGPLVGERGAGRQQQPDAEGWLELGSGAKGGGEAGQTSSPRQSGVPWKPPVLCATRPYND